MTKSIERVSKVGVGLLRWVILRELWPVWVKLSEIVSGTVKLGELFPLSYTKIL